MRHLQLGLIGNCAVNDYRRKSDVGSIFSIEIADLASSTLQEYGLSPRRHIALERRDEARALFNNLLQCSNHLGLLAEHIDPATGEMWGNFPQTYSMVGVILSAMKLSKRWEEAI